MFKTAKQQVTFIAVSVLLTGFSLFSLASFAGPESKAALVFFYISLFLFTLALFTIIGLTIRQWLFPKMFVLDLNASFRQALLIAILILVSFFLLAARLLFWWVELSLILFLLAIEVFVNLKV